MILGSGMYMDWHTIDGPSTFSLHGAAKSLPLVQFRKTTNNISPPTIPNPSRNVSSPPNALFSWKLTGLDCAALGSALVAHLSYYWQADLVNRTDVLDRYKALVIDRVGGDLLLYDT